MVKPFILRIDRSKDNAIYYWIPLISLFYRWRLKAAIDLLPHGEVARLLDVGYGSGFLLSRLAGRARQLYGVDHHDYHVPVRASAHARGLTLRLARGDATALPFASASFDIVCCMSVLEHVADLDTAVEELRRVLRPGGCLVVGFPPKTRLTAVCFRIIGFDYARFHPNDEHAILAALKRTFTIEYVASRPSAAPLFVLARCRREDSP